MASKFIRLAIHMARTRTNIVAVRALCVLTTSILLASCAGGASHVPPPWQLPGAAAGTAIENGIYGRRRVKVKKYLRANWAEIQTDIRAGGGVHMSRAFDLAKVAPAKRLEVLKEIKARPDIYQAGSLEENIEVLTVTLMVHSN